MMSLTQKWLPLLTLTTAMMALGCHADPDDAAGQAEELSDPVRRQNALGNIQRLYTNALADNGGDRANPNVMAVADAVVEKLTQAYMDNPTDNQNRLAILDIMKEMRDPRTLPALTEALHWRAGVNEEHAVRAAQALAHIELPEGEKAAVVTAIGESIGAVTQARPIDNRIRIEMLRTLGAISHPSAQDILIEIATKQDEAQNFLINRLAAQQLGNIATADAIPAMIKCLFLFAPSNPAMRMNDVAGEVLVRIGQPAVAPLLRLLSGDDAEANAIATAYIAAVRERDENAAAQMSVAQQTGTEATYTLGSLGFLAAFDPLLAETESEDMFRRVNGAIALVRLNHTAESMARVRPVLQRVYGSLDDDMQGVQARAQLIAAMRSLYDGDYIPFFMEQAADGDLHPIVRLEAIKAVGLIGNKTQVEALQAWIAGQGGDDPDPYYEQFQQETTHAIATGISCDEDVSCYIGKLDDSEVQVARKAAFMLGRLGRGNDDVIAALVERLGHTDVQVRLSVVAALDRVATAGSQAAVDKIEELRNTEEGRAVWTQFSREALPIQARLRSRIQ